MVFVPAAMMTDHDRCRGAGDARHVVMLRHPDAAIAPGLGMDRDIAGVVERAARIGVFGDADEIENGQCRHETFRTKQCEQNYFARIIQRSLATRESIAAIPA